MNGLSKIIFSIFFGLFFAISTFAQLLPETKKIDGEGLIKLLPNRENKKPVLMNFWATWCGPCRVEFPDLVEIDADYRDKGLNFVLISVDNFALIDTRVPEFLQQYDATMPSYLIDYPKHPQIARAIRRIAPKFTGSFPLTLLFNANGKLIYQKAGVVNPKLLRAQIEKVLPKQNK